LIEVLRGELQPKEGFIHKLVIGKELMTNQIFETLLEVKYKSYIMENLNPSILGLHKYLAVKINDKSIRDCIVFSG
jgi:hypothetical protein